MSWPQETEAECVSVAFLNSKIDSETAEMWMWGQEKGCNIGYQTEFSCFFPQPAHGPSIVSKTRITYATDRLIICRINATDDYTDRPTQFFEDIFLFIFYFQRKYYTDFLLYPTMDVTKGIEIWAHICDGVTS